MSPFQSLTSLFQGKPSTLATFRFLTILKTKSPQKTADETHRTPKQKSLGTTCSQLITFMEFIAQGTQRNHLFRQFIGNIADGKSEGKLEAVENKLKCQGNHSTCNIFAGGNNTSIE